jgi:hypothetical protein
MKNLVKKTWFQMVVGGVIIGAVLIALDSGTNFFHRNKKPDKYNGPIEVNSNETYFTKVELSETKFDFGKVKEGDTVMHEFKIKNSGEEPLMIYKAVGSCDCVVALFTTKPIMPGVEESIKVYFKTIGRKGEQLRTVNIHTNTDPPENMLTLTGTVE